MSTLTIHRPDQAKEGDRIVRIGLHSVLSDRYVASVEPGALRLAHPEPNPHRVEWRVYAEDMRVGVVIERTEADEYPGLCDRDQRHIEFMGGRVCERCGWARKHHRFAPPAPIEGAQGEIVLTVLEKPHVESRQAEHYAGTRNTAPLTAFQRAALDVLHDAKGEALPVGVIVDRMAWPRADVRGTAFSLNTLVTKGFASWGPTLDAKGRENPKGTRTTWRLAEGRKPWMWRRG